MFERELSLVKLLLFHIVFFVVVVLPCLWWNKDYHYHFSLCDPAWTTYNSQLACSIIW